MAPAFSVVLAPLAKAGAVLSAACLALGLQLPAEAAGYCVGFQGDCAPASWLLDQPGDGSVDFAGAPDSVVLTSNDAGPPTGEATTVTMELLADLDGIVSFAYSYLTLDDDGSFYDPFGYLLNGDLVQLVPPPFLLQGGSTSGSFAFPVTAGDSFGFYAGSFDSLLGPAITTISDFSYQQVPGPLPVFGVAAAFSYSRQLKKKLASARVKG
jgi:hypothetical protein